MTITANQAHTDPSLWTAMVILWSPRCDGICFSFLPLKRLGRLYDKDYDKSQTELNKILLHVCSVRYSHGLFLLVTASVQECLPRSPAAQCVALVTDAN
ncbi:hypothetical protein RRG08_044037 [Elysia crispata]|uniref:Uncharacterized protein n=1 Tax=Elysia crispata TaxID=231223 RepID=A0AAE0Y1F0_9GAST|nr:hypothetical protein RRG08_044037 [Elysia crispata]